MTLSNSTVAHWIAGRAVNQTRGRSGEVFNPTTGTVAAQVPFATSEEINAAVRAARACCSASKSLLRLKRRKSPG